MIAFATRSVHIVRRTLVAATYGGNHSSYLQRGSALKIFIVSRLTVIARLRSTKR